MNRQSVTLRAHDSINLTTGMVTRSDHSQVQTIMAHVRDCNVCTRTGSANGCPQGRTLRIAQGLSRNDLQSLFQLITGDPSIPQAPGECFWNPEACKINRQIHGPCLDHSIAGVICADCVDSPTGQCGSCYF